MQYEKLMTCYIKIKISIFVYVIFLCINNILLIFLNCKLYELRTVRTLFRFIH